eukprot:COSAG01_NODE_27280_length_689_cov_4.055932_2_plen_59_part_01
MGQLRRSGLRGNVPWPTWTRPFRFYPRTRAGVTEVSKSQSHGPHHMTDGGRGGGGGGGG